MDKGIGNFKKKYDISKYGKDSELAHNLYPYKKGEDVAIKDNAQDETNILTDEHSEEARLAEGEYLIDNLHLLSEVGLPIHLADKLKITKYGDEIQFTFSGVTDGEKKQAMNHILGSTVGYMLEKMSNENVHQIISEDIEGI